MATVTSSELLRPLHARIIHINNQQKITSHIHWFRFIHNSMEYKLKEINGNKYRNNNTELRGSWYKTIRLRNSICPFTVMNILSSKEKISFKFIFMLWDVFRYNKTPTRMIQWKLDCRSRGRINQPRWLASSIVIGGSTTSPSDSNNLVPWSLSLRFSIFTRSKAFRLVKNHPLFNNLTS